jgi:hypothetical protein
MMIMGGARAKLARSGGGAEEEEEEEEGGSAGGLVGSGGKTPTAKWQNWKSLDTRRGKSRSVEEECGALSQRVKKNGGGGGRKVTMGRVRRGFFFG